MLGANAEPMKSMPPGRLNGAFDSSIVRDTGRLSGAAIESEFRSKGLVQHAADHAVAHDDVAVHVRHGVITRADHGTDRKRNVGRGSGRGGNVVESQVRERLGDAERHLIGSRRGRREVADDLDERAVLFDDDEVGPPITAQVGRFGEVRIVAAGERVVLLPRRLEPQGPTPVLSATRNSGGLPIG